MVISYITLCSQGVHNVVHLPFKAKDDVDGEVI